MAGDADNEAQCRTSRGEGLCGVDACGFWLATLKMPLFCESAIILLEYKS